MDTQIHINKIELNHIVTELEKTYDRCPLNAGLIDKLSELSKNKINIYICKTDKKLYKIEVYQQGALYREWTLDKDNQPIINLCKKYLFY